MYFPSATQPPSVGEDQGIWAPIDHQRVISLLTIGLDVLYYREKSISLEPLPDVLLRDNETDETPVIIEVCKTTGLKSDLQNVIQLIDGDLYGIREGFIYNYKTSKWLRYHFGDGGLTPPTSFSDVLDLDLNAFLL
ncbi:hypothetical protein [Spirosoma arcticum]